MERILNLKHQLEVFDQLGLGKCLKTAVNNFGVGVL
jgi:hypothetical protein